MELILTIFPYASPEIVTAAFTCFFMTLFGLSLGFALLKVQGEQTKFNNNILILLLNYFNGTDETRTRNFRRDRAVL